MHVTGWSVSSTLHLMVHLNLTHLLLSLAPLAGFRQLVTGWCERPGIASIICSINSVTLKYSKGCAYRKRQERRQLLALKSKMSSTKVND